MFPGSPELARCLADGGVIENTPLLSGNHRLASQINTLLYRNAYRTASVYMQRWHVNTFMQVFYACYKCLQITNLGVLINYTYHQDTCKQRRIALHMLSHLERVLSPRRLKWSLWVQWIASVRPCLRTVIRSPAEQLQYRWHGENTTTHTVFVEQHQESKKNVYLLHLCRRLQYTRA